MNINWSQQAERQLGYQQFTSLTGSTALVIPSKCEFVEVTVEAQPVRWRADGTAPTAGVGMPLAVGESKIFTMQQIPQLRFIEQAVGAILNVTYYGR